MRRRRSRRHIARLARRQDVDGLARVLASRDVVKDRDGLMLDLAVPTRVQALEVLAQIEDDRAAGVAADALGDPDPRVRLVAVQALERCDPDGRYDATLAEALVRWDADGQSVEHAAAVEWLRQRSSPAQVALLVDGLLGAGPGRAIRPADQQAIAAIAVGHGAELRALCRRLVDDLAPDGDPRTERILVALGQPAVEPLVGALRGPGTLRAIGVLTDLRPTRAVEPLVSLVGDDDDPDVRAAAARALGAIRDPQASEALLRASLDSDSAVRDAAQVALEQLGTAGILAGLAAFVAPLVGRIEQLEAAQREAPQLPRAPDEAQPANDGTRRSALGGLRRALGR